MKLEEPTARPPTGSTMELFGRRIVTFLVVFIASATLFQCAPKAQPADPAPLSGVRPYALNPRYLTDVHGNPVFAIGSYRFMTPEQGDWRRVLDYATDHGLNTVRALAIADGWIQNHGSPATPMPYARTGGGRIAADGGGRFDLTRFDPRFWDNFAAFLSAADSRGLIVVSELFGVSGPFGGGDRKCTPDPPHHGCFINNFWHRGNSVNGPAAGGNDWRTQSAARRDFFDPRGSMRAVQEAILSRYLDITSRHQNVIYQPVNEMFEYRGLDNSRARQWMNWVRDTIRERVPGAVVLLNTTIYPQYGIDVPGYQGITIHAPYEGNGPVPGRYDLTRMNEDLTTLAPRRSFVGYDCDVGQVYEAADYQDYQRRAAWTAFTSGAGMYIILENVFEPPWTDTPLLEPGRDLEFLARFLTARTIEPWTMAPGHGLAVGPAGATTTVLARPGEVLIAYLREGGEIGLDPRHLPLPRTAEWYDPRTGTFSPAEETRRQYSAFTAPQGGDWVLLIRATERNP